MASVRKALKNIASGNRPRKLHPPSRSDDSAAELELLSLPNAIPKQYPPLILVHVILLSAALVLLPQTPLPNLPLPEPARPTRQDPSDPSRPACAGSVDLAPATHIQRANSTRSVQLQGKLCHLPPRRLPENGSLRIVHNLQPLNAITIRNAAVSRFVNQFVEGMATHACYSMLDRRISVHCPPARSSFPPTSLPFLFPPTRKLMPVAVGGTIGYGQQ